MVRIRPVTRARSHARQFLVALALLGFLGSTPSASAGPQVALMAGYGISFFDDEFMRFLGTTAHGKEVPIGLVGTVPVVGRLSLGVELRLSLMPFTWDYRLSNESAGETTVSQNAISAVARYDFGRGSFFPYLRAGVGVYSGSAKLRGDPSAYPDENIDFRRSVGVSAAAGLQGGIGPDKFWFGELIIHAVRRTLDVEGYGSWAAHNCAVQLGLGRLF
ncbi:hypothetical protein JXA88_16445 [Candidatus Fermentibacteria bacterium]|nr:hypothetical protein [Candidatus Fermentibacteria bacterium]